MRNLILAWFGVILTFIGAILTFATAAHRIQRTLALFLFAGAYYLCAQKPHR